VFSFPHQPRSGKRALHVTKTPTHVEETFQNGGGRDNTAVCRRLVDNAGGGGEVRGRIQQELLYVVLAGNVPIKAAPDLSANRRICSLRTLYYFRSLA
ncbi:unnamed protein product, partial [Ectocarpus sp. 12 AP-2014]